jgi:hypothetical protein
MPGHYWPGSAIARQNYPQPLVPLSASSPMDSPGVVCSLLDARRPRSDGKSYSQQITFVVDRPGHDLRYAIDPSHAESILGWKATEAFATGLAKTIDWYLANSDCLIPVKELGRLGTRTVAPANAPSQRLGEI